MTIVGEMVARTSFALRGSERREWLRSRQTKDKYNPYHGVPESRMPLPRGRATVRTVSAWGVKSASRGRDPARRVNLVKPVWKPVRPVWAAHIEKPVRLVPELVRLVWRQ
jgi:hypothetical protein